jgi:hypothetical protein
MTSKQLLWPVLLVIYVAGFFAVPIGLSYLSLQAAVVQFIIGGYLTIPISTVIILSSRNVAPSRPRGMGLYVSALSTLIALFACIGAAVVRGGFVCVTAFWTAAFFACLFWSNVIVNRNFYRKR